jgi:hypothetical protein
LDTPTAVATETPAPVATPVTDLEAMTPEERTNWRVTGTYPERKPADEAPAVPETPATDVPQHEADSAQPDDAISEAARTLRRNRASERKQRIQDEINDLTRKRHEAERELETIHARRRALETPPTPTTPSAPVPEREPLIDQFDGDFTAFLRARDTWLLSQFEQRQQQAREAQQRTEAERQYAARLEAHAQRVEQARQQFADWDVVVNNPELPQVPTAVLQALQDSPQGPRLAYRLARDPERMRALASMTPHAAVLEVGRLAADLDAPVKAAPKTLTSAPPPAPSLGERPGVPSDAVMDAAISGDFSRYKAEVNAQARAAGRNW